MKSRATAIDDGRPATPTDSSRAHYFGAVRSRTPCDRMAANTKAPPKKAQIMTTTAKPETGKPWQASENDAIAADYLDMLSRELLATTYNKAAHRRALIAGALAVRSHGSIEMKHCNISAVMRAARLPWINGYKPLGHGQARPLAAAIVRGMLAAGWSDDDIRAIEKAHKL
jgi:hypothetical protein